MGQKATSAVPPKLANDICRSPACYHGLTSVSTG